MSQSLLGDSPRRRRKSVTGQAGEGGGRLSRTSRKSSSSEISTGKWVCGSDWGWSGSCSSPSESESSLRRRMRIGGIFCTTRGVF